MTTAITFVRQQLASAGWAPISHETAMLLCPEVARDHQTFTTWQNTPEVLPRTFPGAAVYRAQVHGHGEMLVLSRSPQFLAERMGWLGLPAVSMVEIQPARAKAEGQARAVSDIGAALNKAREGERLSRLRALADEETPAHDCDRRRQILAARAEIERLAPA